MLIIPGITPVAEHDKQDMGAFRDRQVWKPCEAMTRINLTGPGCPTSQMHIYSETTGGVRDCTPRPRKDGVETTRLRLTFFSPAVAMTPFRGMVQTLSWEHLISLDRTNLRLPLSHFFPPHTADIRMLTS
jgi:hypothetical protein